MAIQVPIYEQRVDSAALPEVRAATPVQPFGQEALARGVEQLGRGVASAMSDVQGVWAREKAKADQARVMDAYAQLGAVKTSAMEELLQVKGADAVGLSFRIQDQAEAPSPQRSTPQLSGFFKRAKDIADTLTPEQREAFESLWHREQQDLVAKASQHEAREVAAFRQQAVASALAAATSDAVVKAEDLTAEVVGSANGVTEAIELGKSFLRAKESLDGTAPIEIDHKVKDYESKAHVAAMEALIAADKPEVAAAYLEARKGQIQPLDLKRSNIRSVIETTLTKREGEKLAQQYLADAAQKVNPDTDKPYPLEAGFQRVLDEHAKELDSNPRLRSAVLAAAKERITLRKKEIELEDGEKLSQLSLMLVTQGLKFDLEQNADAAKLFAELSVDSQVQFQKDLRQELARLGKEGRESASEQARLDRQALSDFMVLSPSEQESIVGDINEIYKDASATARNHITRLARQAIANNAAQGGPDKADAAFDMVLEGFQAALKRPLDKREQAALRSYTNKRFNAWHAQHAGDLQKHPGLPDVRAWVDDGLVWTIEQGLFTNSRTRMALNEEFAPLTLGEWYLFIPGRGRTRVSIKDDATLQKVQQIISAAPETKWAPVEQE